ncbi:cyclic lactone autoinducer peptide [Paenibacillus koleovorans]|nr:cyclic lactone autoinducer peptide [Paenibacillus koleovorans]
MKKIIARNASQILSVLAVVFVSAASFWWVHNPKVPKELLENVE